MADHKGADQISQYSPGLIGNNTFGGECSIGGLRLNSNNGIDDSGTESGEEVRVLKPEVIQEVQSALSRLEDFIPGLDPTKRDAVTQLVNSLQTCLKIPPPVIVSNSVTPIAVEQMTTVTPAVPPRRFGSKKALRNRHTVGVTREELADARRWIDENHLKRYSPQSNYYGSNDSLMTKVFRPVRFDPPVPPVIEEKVTLPAYLTKMTLVKKQYNRPLLHRAGYFMEPGPQNGILSFVYPEQCPSVERSTSDTGSLYDYDPSLNLFTPEQSVQIAVHKAAINKQISREELRRRGSSEDGDVSSGDEEIERRPELSSAQRLLMIATDDKSAEITHSNNNTTVTKSNKKMKMKRSNTIDIPKPSNFYDYGSDDYGVSADEGIRKAYDDLPTSFSSKEKKIIPPTFEPKTENDLKFLAFLKQVSTANQSKVHSYNPSARGGKHWQNRFSRIKTAFEGSDLKQIAQTSITTPPSSAKLFWQNTENDLSNTKQQNNNNNNKAQHSNQSSPLQSKLPWTVKTEENGVVVGSLTVSKPGHVNHFKHAAISAFKPIEKKQQSTVVSPVSGSVKQIAAQKFSVTPTQEFQTKTDRNIYNKSQTPIKALITQNYTNKAEQKSFPINSNTTQKTYSTAYHPPAQETIKSRIITNKFLTENLDKQEQHFSKDLNSVKTWSYTKPSDKKNTGFSSAHAPLKTFESQLNKEPIVKPVSTNYTRNIGRTFETVPSILKKASDNCLNTPTTANKDDYRESKQYINNHNRGSIYSKLPFINDHIPSVYNRSKTEMNGHDSSPRKYNNYINPTASRNYFNELNTRNASLINMNTNSTSSFRDKQRFSLPENKLIEQRKDNNTFKSNDSINNLQSLELRIAHNDSDKVLTTPINKGHYNNCSYGDSERQKQNIIISSPSGDNTEYYRKTPNINYQLSPDNVSNSRECQKQNIVISCPSKNNTEYYGQSPSSNYDLTPEENVDNSIASRLNTNYSYLPEDLTTLNDHHKVINYSPQAFQEISPTKLTPPSSSKLNDQFITISSYEAAAGAQHSKSPSSILMDDTNSITSSPFLWVKDSLDSSPPGRHSVGQINSQFDKSSLLEKCTEEKAAVTKVMGQAQCQQAITVNSRTKRRYDSPKSNIENELKLNVNQTAKQKALSPSFPNVIQKSESWHQMVIEQMQQAKQAPPLPKISKAKSSHTLALPKQFEAALTPESVTHKKLTVSQYLAKQQQTAAHLGRKKNNNTVKLQQNHHSNNEDSLDEDLNNVDEVFESIFQESNKKRNSK